MKSMTEKIREEKNLGSTNNNSRSKGENRREKRRNRIER